MTLDELANKSGEELFPTPPAKYSKKPSGATRSFAPSPVKKYLIEPAKRVGGMALGILNAPFTFLPGVFTPAETPEEWKEFEKSSLPQKLAIRLGSGFNSAFESAFKKGSFGKDWGDYYKSTTGENPPTWYELTFNFLADPILPVALATAQTRTGISSGRHILDYLKSGKTPFPKGFYEAFIATARKNPLDFLNDLEKLQTLDNATKQELQKEVLGILGKRRDILKEAEISGTVAKWKETGPPKLPPGQGFELQEARRIPRRPYEEPAIELMKPKRPSVEFTPERLKVAIDKPPFLRTAEDRLIIQEKAGKVPPLVKLSPFEKIITEPRGAERLKIAKTATSTLVAEKEIIPTTKIKLPSESVDEGILKYDFGGILNDEKGMVDLSGLRDTVNLWEKKLKEAGILSDPELAAALRVLNEKDLGKTIENFRKPYWVGRQFEEEAPQALEIVKRQSARENTRWNMCSIWAEMAKPYLELKKGSRGKVNKALHWGEQSKIEKFDDDFLRKAFKLNNEEIQGYKAYRKTVNDIWDDRILRLEDAEPPKFLKDGKTVSENWKRWNEALNETTSQRIPGYVPHSWYGKYNVFRIAPDGNLEIYAFNSKILARSKVREFAKTDINLPEIRKAIEIPDSLYTDIDTLWTESLIRKSASKANLTETQVKEILSNFQEEMMARGWSKHRLHRKGVGGYEQDLWSPLQDYITGYAGSVTKADAAVDFYKLHGEMTANMSELKNYFAETIKYYLSNKDTTKTQRVIKATLFDYFLGANLKQILVNSTQQATAFLPVMGTITKSPSVKLTKTYKDMIRGSLSADDLNGFKRVMQKYPQDMSAEMLAELTGKKGYPGYETIRTVGDMVNAILRWPLKFSETKINRRPAFLTAYRIFRSQGYDVAKATDKAMDKINQTHYLYGKSNRANIERGKLQATMVFRSFALNYMEMLADLARHKEYGALAKSIAAMGALAGTSGYFGVGIMSWAYKKAFGESPDVFLKKTISKYVGEKGIPIAEAISIGLPTLLGIDLHGSVGMGDILFGDIEDTLKNVVRGVAKQIIGAPFAFGERMAKGTTQVLQGDTRKGVETLSPEFLRNPQVGYRLATEGATTFTGKDILDIEGEQFKLKPWEAIIKGAGVQPARYSRFMRGREEMKDYIQDAQAITNDIAHRVILAQDTGDIKQEDKIWTELDKINIERDKLNLPPIIITNKMLNQRREVESLPKKWWGKEQEIKELYK